MKALLDLILVPVVVAYSIVMLMLFVYVFNYFYLAWLGWRKRTSVTSPTRREMTDWPYVTIQLPIYNELYVAGRLIEAAAALDYPCDRLEIQVLDDSTDDTFDLVRETVNGLCARGIQISHIHREKRTGFKAGALANGLMLAHGDYLAIFDADFIPQPDFLRRTVPYFDEERIAFVQARWGHLNRDYSLLTYLQSLSLDAHFAIDQSARSASGFIFNFNGTAGVWRKSAILDAGGWRADTLTEDLDLSYRVFLRGWSASYAGDVEVPGELPVSFTAYRRQQHRWARGGLECAIRYIPDIWRTQLPFLHKLQATLHLTGYGLHLLTLALICLYPILLALATEYPTLLEPIGIGVVMNVLVLAPTTYFAIAQRLLRRRWLSSLPMIFLMSVLSSGMVLNTLRAALQILRKKKIPFERTPKYAITRRSQSWTRSRYHVRIDVLIVFEIALACLNVWTAWEAWKMGFFFITIYAFLFAVSLFFTSGFTLLQSLSMRFTSDR